MIICYFSSLLLDSIHLFIARIYKVPPINIEKKEVNVSCAMHKFLNIQSVTLKIGVEKYPKIRINKAFFSSVGYKFKNSNF